MVRRQMWGMVLALLVVVPWGASSARAAAVAPGTTATTMATVNLRTGPGTQHAVQQVLLTGATVYVNAGPINATWYDVSYHDVRGYVPGAQLQRGEAAAGGSSGTTMAPVNLRTGPGTQHAVQQVLPVGARVSGVEGPTNGVWWKVQYASTIGYIHGQYLGRTGGNGGAKRIVIDLSDQWVYAYEGDVQVLASPTSTGKDGFNTPIGAFSVVSKHPYSTMQGSAGGDTWYVPDVPFAMYFTDRGHAIHGAPWVPDDVFGSGTRLSHGCAGLPVGNAEWFFNWTPVGTPVQVRW